MSLPQGTLLGIGNPLLDISANVPQEYLEKYGLKTGNAILAEEKHLPIYSEIVKQFNVEYIAGGAAQNSIRAASWMLQQPGVSAYIGAVGNDENGKYMKEAAEKYGVKTYYMTTNDKPTGTCAVLVRDKERSLVANLAAAELHKITHIETPEISEVISKAKYFYATGFFLTHSPDTLVSIGKHAKEHNKPFLFNLAAPFLIQFFWDRVASVLPYADVVFCNDDEARALGEKQGWGNDLVEIASKLASFAKENKNRKRTVIFTQGAKETLVFQEGQEVLRFKPIECKPEEIVDTNGAGDSFVGGFLSQYIQEKPIDVCVDAAHYCAWECIRRSGATYPDHPTWKSKQ